MTDLTMAAKAHTAVINLAPPGPPRAEAVTAVAVNGVPVAFTIATGGIRLAEPLAADALPQEMRAPGQWSAPSTDRSGRS